MSTCHKHSVLNGLQTVGRWFLVLAVMIMTLQPLHFHVHHNHDANVDALGVGMHEHVVEQHGLAEWSEDEHHANAIIIDSTPDSIVKASDNMLVTPMLLFVFLLFVLLSPGLGSNLKRLFRRQAFDSFAYHFTPPLRAPPR